MPQEAREISLLAVRWRWVYFEVLDLANHLPHVRGKRKDEAVVRAKAIP